jgi:hypothetical protein
MRLKAPEHAADVSVGGETYAVVDGFIEVPDDMHPASLGLLSANGFVREYSEAAPAAEALAATSDKAAKADKKADQGAGNSASEEAAQPND